MHCRVGGGADDRHRRRTGTPRVPPTTDLSYPRLIGSLWTLVRTHAVLRRAVAVQFLIFAAFIGFWSNLALLLAGAISAGLALLVSRRS